MKLFRNSIIALALALVICAPNVHAATSVDDMLKLIQDLMAQIQTLQTQLNTVKSDVRSVLKSGLSEGMTDADIQKIQEILATDPTIYPEGKKTGFFGPLTKEAVKRFQKRHELEITGTINAETRDLLEEYLHEGKGGAIPPGLLNAPGIRQKIEMRYESQCAAQGSSTLCTRLKVKYKDNSRIDEDEDEDASSDDDDDNSGWRNDDDDDDGDNEDEDDDDNSSHGGTTTPPVSSSSSSTTVSTAVVAAHNTAADCWVIVSNNAYNVTQYIPFHPGGKSAISSRCGADITAAFTSSSNGGRKHSTKAHTLLANYLVGSIK